MSERQTLKDLLEQTDALTYLNALQVTLKELKSQFSVMEEMSNYNQQACDKAKKLLRRADHQYRVVAKLVQGNDIVSKEVIIEDITDLEIEELLKDE